MVSGLEDCGLQSLTCSLLGLYMQSAIIDCAYQHKRTAASECQPDGEIADLASTRIKVLKLILSEIDALCAGMPEGLLHLRVCSEGHAWLLWLSALQGLGQSKAFSIDMR